MFWLGVGAIALCIAALPLIRLVCKRISFVLRLQNVCREKKYTFTPLHPLWFLPLRGGDTFDFAVETREDAYAVKFFGVWRRQDVLRFGPTATYRVHHRVAFLSPFGERTAMTLWESPEKPLPHYRYPGTMAESYAGKLWKPLLLMHPVGYSILLSDTSGKEAELGSGDTAIRYPITSAFQFLESLRCAPGMREPLL